MRGAVLALVIALGAWAPATASAQPAAGALPADDPSFGPVLLIEQIEVTGNRATAPRLIRRALPVREGDVLRAGDPRLRSARYKVLALGFFREVELALRRGSARGRVILTVRVVERGTIVLNLLQFGTSRATPWWVGADATERNLLGTGLGLGLGFLYAGAGEIDGASSQWAGELRLADATLLGSPLGVHGGLLYKDAFEPYRVTGTPADEGVANFRGFDYRRAGAVAGIGWDATPLSRLSVDARYESVRAELPDAPTRTTPDGELVPVELDLHPGDSRVATVAVGFDRDTRADPVLPYGGDRLVVVGELGHSLIGSSYDYARLLASYDHWWPVRGRAHVVAVKLLGGLILGDAPRFDLLHAADMNRMMTPRAFGLLLSAESATDFLGNAADESGYGEVGGAAAVEYSYRLFRRKRHIYGGDLFVGAGLWTTARRDQLSVRDRALYDALPVGLMLDAGLRLDTEIGIFELTIANALGRVQF